ncbi:methionine ABC transporter ATP-binding protein [Ornithinimicrobium cryptoxanthini]|uniref:Methionine ABC transporter ATP-binding protein n=1 Tax=Ornithinimicrobium cryptoxanthini TaxID=2934161 RepID=A0ABY4YDZ4_9MICO|nr:methionine ABC transporter ATP-binding protein [Ornithinimicrobium cryptoxanthini]USQ74995.1 methionine ABC transporter ATP-binding protein [Ornithinimicrobium cryptoxanthini]
MPPIIEFRDVSKVFRGRASDLTAVDHVDLSIEQGEIFAVIGYSGAGKSTLVRLINGLERVTSGELIVDGQNVAELSESQMERKRRDVGMIFQQFNLFGSRTVAGNVDFPLRVAGWPKDRRAARVAELLDFVGLLDRAHAYPNQLSGGQKQRVGIARALAAGPKILLADEATSALDPETTQDVLRLLKKVNTELGVTVVVITHELEIVRAIADRVAILENGHVAEIGTVFETFSNPRSEVGRRFVSTVIHDQPRGEDLARIRAAHPGRIVTATIHDGSRLGAVLADAGAHGVRFEIVYGGIGTLQARSFGSLTLALTGSEDAVDRVVTELRDVTEIQEVA